VTANRDSRKSSSSTRRSPQSIRQPAAPQPGYAGSDRHLVTFLDGDDIWTSGKIDIEMAAFDDPALGLLYSDYVDFRDAHLDEGMLVCVRRLSGRRPHLAKDYYVKDAPIRAEALMSAWSQRAETRRNSSGAEKNVVMLTHEYSPFPGGEATCASGIVAGLRSLGCEVVVIGPDYSDYDLENVGEEESDPGLIPLLVHQKVDPWRTFAFIFRYFLRARSALFIAGEIRAGLILSVLSLAFPVRFLAMFHGSELAKAQNRPLFRWAAAFVIGRAAGLCTNSQATLDLLRKVRNSPRVEQNSRVVHLGLDPYWLSQSLIDSPPDRWLELADVKDLRPDDAIVLTVGRIEPRKGQLQGIEIVEQAQKLVDRKIVYLIVGKTIDRAYHDLVQERAQASFVDIRLTGVISRERLRALYRVGDALLLPAQTTEGKFEGFGLVFTEAASQGCPSIGSRIGGVEDAIADGRSGFLFDEADQHAFVQQLATILGDRDLRAQLRTTCLEHARQYRWENCAKRALAAVT
jgi:phosphatidylinositol alpha-1,6-mannosyltransferase